MRWGSLWSVLVRDVGHPVSSRSDALHKVGDSRVDTFGWRAREKSLTEALGKSRVVVDGGRQLVVEAVRRHKALRAMTLEFEIRS